MSNKEKSWDIRIPLKNPVLLKTRPVVQWLSSRNFYAFRTAKQDMFTKFCIISIEITNWHCQIIKERKVKPKIPYLCDELAIFLRVQANHVWPRLQKGTDRFCDALMSQLRYQLFIVLVNMENWSEYWFKLCSVTNSNALVLRIHT